MATAHTSSITPLAALVFIERVIMGR